jgi:transcriptional regulator with XRE-family HTH domain
MTVPPQPETPKTAGDPYKAERERLLRVFGAKLRAERECRNISQETLAAIVNVHRTHLGALEQGLREPGLAMLLILADGLEVAPSALLDGLFVPRERKAPTHFKSGHPRSGVAQGERR